MNFQHLLYIKTVMQMGSVTRAAEKLNIQQSVLSRTIKNVEDELGAKLFRRDGNKLYTNSNGYIVLRHVDEIENLMLMAKSEICRNVQPKITVASEVLLNILPEMILAFQREHNEIDMQLLNVDEGTILLPSIPYDVLFFATFEDIKYKNVDILFDQRMHIAVPNDHPMAGRKSAHLSEFANDAFLCMEKSSGFRKVVERLCHRSGFSPRFVFETDDKDSMSNIQFIKSGNAVCMIPKSNILTIPTKGISFIPITDPVATRYICMYWRDTPCYNAQAISSFREHVTSFFDELRGQ